MNLTESVQFGDYELRAAVLDNRGAGEHPLF
jgi:hypothetical protein